MQTEERQQSIRDGIDQWTVATSGLNPRVVHCLQQAGVRTVGELRGWSDDRLLKLRHFGLASLNNVKRFFRLARKVEQQDFSQFPELRTLFKEFLNKQELFVLEERFRLHDPLYRPHMRRETLQAIADKLGGMTRERVRQIEEEGLRNLTSQLCCELMRPFELQWVNAIQARGEAITGQELAEWSDDPRLGGYQPWGLLRLISEVCPAIHLHFDYFSTLTPKALGQIEAQAIALLQQSNGLVPAQAIHDGLRGSITDPQGRFDRLLNVVLDHHPDICATNNGEYFLTDHGTPLIIRDIFRAESKPIHFRNLTEIYNQRMLPASRKGSGCMLRILNVMPEVQRVDRALYQLCPATA